MDLWADLCGFAGSLLLLFPALRVMDLLRRSHEVEKAARTGSGQHRTVGLGLSRILDGYTRKWNPKDYWAFICGMLLLFASFGLKLLGHFYILP